MAIEAICDSCGHKYFLDEARFEPSAGPVPCPECGKTMSMSLSEAPDRGSTTQERPAAGAPSAPAGDAMASEPPAPASPPPPAGGPSSPVASVATGAAAPAPQSVVAAEPEQVVCPRCGLHFLPRREEAEAARRELRPALVVDDMEYFVDIAQESLGQHFEVRTAANLEEAVRAMQGTEIDLLVVDVNLAGGAGRALLQQLRVKPCPILVFTEWDESEIYGDAWKALEALGADDLVIKGMNAGDSLLRKACELLDLPYDEEDTPQSP